MTAVLENPRETIPMSNLNALYSQDYTAWAKQMADLLKAGQFAELDIAHLLEELEGMGASERNELENRFNIGNYPNAGRNSKVIAGVIR